MSAAEPTEYTNCQSELMGDNPADLYGNVGQLSALTSDMVCDVYTLINVLTSLWPYDILMVAWRGKESKRLCRSDKSEFCSYTSLFPTAFESSTRASRRTRIRDMFRWVQVALLCAFFTYALPLPATSPLPNNTRSLNGCFNQFTNDWQFVFKFEE